MVEVVHFKKEHAEILMAQERNKPLAARLSPGVFEALEEKEIAYTMLHSGRPVFIGGVVPMYGGRGEAWAVLDENCGKQILSIHKVVKNFLAACEYRRIEAVVEIGFESGHRWVKSLGFKKEAEKMESFRPNGDACSLYAMVKGGSYGR